MASHDLPINHEDLTDERKEYLFKLPRTLEQYFLSHLVEKADIVMLHLLFNIVVITGTGAALLYFSSEPSHWLGLAHVVVSYALFLQRFVLTLHFASHRNLFNDKSLKPGFNFVLQFLYCPFFGIPSACYHLHHIVMHHIENNVMPYDVSATMTYQRDSVFHFLCYWFRYTFAIWFQLPYYAYRRGRFNLLYRNVFASVCYMVGLYFLYSWKPVATLWVFIIPYFVTSFALMFGNWCQHIFVDPARFDDSYALTYNLINTPMNKLTYNDGYHIVHHLNSQIHWTKLPTYFLQNREKFFQNNSLTFEKLDFAAVGFFLFTGQYEKLASYHVHLGTPETKKSVQELTAQFKEWLKPIPVPTESAKSAMPKSSKRTSTGISVPTTVPVLVAPALKLF